MHKLMASEATHKAKKLTEIFSKSKNFFSLFCENKKIFLFFQGNKNKIEMRSVQALEQEKCES
jgi:phosphatidylserine decarboxylase